MTDKQREEAAIERIVLDTMMRHGVGPKGRMEIASKARRYMKRRERRRKGE